MNLHNKISQIISSPHNRLKLLEKWLYEEVWSSANFHRLKPSEYLEEGEKQVHFAEELILTTAYSLYDELSCESLKTKPLINYLCPDEKTAFVILDGTSIREIPLLEKLAESSGFNIIDSSYSFSALPSDSEYFIEQRITGKGLSPSHLPGRKELTDNNIKCYYYDAPTRSFPLPDDKNLLLWSHFPDGTYKNLNAKFSSHFNEMTILFDTVWKNIVMAVPNDYKIIITSDHGYIFFGPGLDSTHASPSMFLDGYRFKFINENEVTGYNTDNVQVMPQKNLVMLRGRIKNRLQGPGGNKAYRHGGMSIMEMLTPWIVLKRN